MLWMAASAISARVVPGLRQSRDSSHSSEAHVTSQRHTAALIPGRKAGSAGRHTRTFAAYRDFDGALGWSWAGWPPSFLTSRVTTLSNLTLGARGRLPHRAGGGPPVQIVVPKSGRRRRAADGQQPVSVTTGEPAWKPWRIMTTDAAIDGY
jgi:hypothetical protein